MPRNPISPLGILDAVQAALRTQLTLKRDTTWIANVSLG
jgi:hypothetical protein